MVFRPKNLWTFTPQRAGW